MANGAAALDALCAYAREALRIHTLIAITSVENTASRQLAAKCGFIDAGPAREGAHLVVYTRFEEAIRSGSQ